MNAVATTHKPVAEIPRKELSPEGAGGGPGRGGLSALTWTIKRGEFERRR